MESGLHLYAEKKNEKESGITAETLSFGYQ
jgi:hypothetical protein